MRKSFFKYVTPSEEDLKWGMHVADSGASYTKPHEEYPEKEHPTGYYYRWENGRVLQEFQVIYVVRGEGLFESRQTGYLRVPAGTIILVFPGIWHRYTPVKETGWDYYWVGFGGEYAENLVNKGFYNPKNPVIHIGHHEQLVALFIEIFELLKEENAGYQPCAAGVVMHIMGFIHSRMREKDFENSETQELVKKAKILFIENITTGLSPEDVASILKVGYSKFRKLFKQYTGMAPGQYQISLRIQKAKELLMQPSLSIKEIGYHLGFESNHYFTRLFKEKTGFSPGAYRDQAYGHVKINRATKQ
ncbi:MAG: helix-turn-helix domain-containing protein [Cyclobacteriaceae bacterium]